MFSAGVAVLVFAEIIHSDPSVFWLNILYCRICVIEMNASGEQRKRINLTLLYQFKFYRVVDILICFNMSGRS